MIEAGAGRTEWSVGWWQTALSNSHLCLSLFSSCLSDPDRRLKPYSLVHPVVVKSPRPVVLSPSCIASRLIRNLLDLPTSRLNFHVCPAGRQLRVADTYKIALGAHG